MTQPPRTISDFLTALANASNPYEATQFTLQPGDFKAIARLRLVIDWFRENETAHSGFRAYEARRIKGRAP